MEVCPSSSPRSPGVVCYSRSPGSPSPTLGSPERVSPSPLDLDLSAVTPEAVGPKARGAVSPMVFVRQSARPSQSRLLLDGRVHTIQEKASLHAAARDLSPVASDNGIVFRGEKGPILEQICAICAKEKPEGALAEAHAFAARGVPSSQETTNPGHRENRGGAAPSLVIVAGTSRGFGLTGGGRQLMKYLRQEEIDIVGLQETILQDFSMHELQRLSRHQFSWQWLPAAGHSRGILLGVREDAFSVEDMDRGEFFVSMAVTDRRVHLGWEVIIVYGPTDHGRSADFLAELKNKVERRTTPVVVAGDFNLISPEDISSHIYSFHKELFSAQPRGGTSLCEDFWPLADQVSDAENAELTLSFSPEQVSQVIASMKACSALGPDGLPVVFFQRFWETLRPVIMPMFHEFYIGTLDMGRINFGVIALIPKVVGASDIRQFVPITVINVLAQIFAKHRIADNLNFKLAAFPISYLGMPLAESRVLVSGFDPLVGRVASRAEPWCGRFTSKGNKTVLISSNLASLPMYMMGMYILPEGVHSAFDKELARFFWQAADGRPKYHMVKWADICLPKDRGGLGIPASRRMNVALMLRWVWRILQGDGGLWLQLIEAKYLRGRALWCFVREALGPEWEAHDLAEFLQHWHPLARTRDRNRLQRNLDALMTSARRVSARSHAA
ncbi:retrotransposon unclassified [Hordeum vulgare]|nr:retrotransposon unclassified [Hordeum vulgare]